MEESRGSWGCFTTDRELVIRSWDGWMAGTTGVGEREAVGRPLTGLFPEIADRGLDARFRRVVEEGVVETLAPAFHGYLISCPPGQPSDHFDRMQQRVTIAPLRAHGSIVGTLVTIEEVTARRDREKRLAEELKHPEERRRLQAAEALAGGEGVGLLVGALGDESWQVRRTAVSGLARRTPQETVRELLFALKEQHRDPSVLNSALQVLALSDLDTLAQLTGFLQDPDAELRGYAALLLGERHDARAVPALLACVDDPDPNVRYHAIEALGKLRDPAALERLLAVAETKDFFLAFPALDAIAQIGDPRAAARLVPFLEDPLLCPPAADALGQLGEGDVVVPLAALLNAAGAPAAVVAQALVAIQRRYERRYREGNHIADTARRAIDAAGARLLLEAIPEATDDELHPITVVLGWLEGPAVERAMTRLLGNPALRAEVVTALSRYGSRVVEPIVEQLRSGDPETKKAGAIALGRIGDARAVPALTALLDEDDELAVLAAGALAKIGDRGAFEALLGLLGHPGAAVRQAAVGALNSLGHPDMGETMEALLADPDPLVRESAVRIAGYFGYERCRTPLLERVADADEKVRRTAIQQLPHLEDERAVPALLLAVRDDTPPVRAAAAEALAEVAAPGAAEALLACLADPDPWVRYFAARSLGQRGEPAAMAPLARLAREDGAGQVRIAAVKALGGIGGAGSIPLLAAVAADPWEDIALAALSALGRIDHPDAQAALALALDSPDAARRIGAVRGLAQRRDPASVDRLAWTVTADADPQVQGAAIDALAAIGTPAAVSALIGITLRPAQREAAIAALAASGDEQLAPLAAALAQPQVEVRLALIEVLTRIKRSAAAELLVRALDDRNERVREAAIRALARLGSRRAERRLMAIAVSDPAAEVRRAARRALDGT